MATAVMLGQKAMVANVGVGDLGCFSSAIGMQDQITKNEFELVGILVTPICVIGLKDLQLICSRFAHQTCCSFCCALNELDVALVPVNAVVFEWQQGDIAGAKDSTVLRPLAKGMENFVDDLQSIEKCSIVNHLEVDLTFSKVGEDSVERGHNRRPVVFPVQGAKEDSYEAILVNPQWRQYGNLVRKYRDVWVESPACLRHDLRRGLDGMDGTEGQVVAFRQANEPFGIVVDLGDDQASSQQFTLDVQRHTPKSLLDKDVLKVGFVPVESSINRASHTGDRFQSRH